MKGTDNLKKIINNNLDMESNNQIKRNIEKDVRTEENSTRNISINS